MCAPYCVVQTEPVCCENGVNLIIGGDFLFSFAVNVNEQRIIAFLTENFVVI